MLLLLQLIFYPDGVYQHVTMIMLLLQFIFKYDGVAAAAAAADFYLNGVDQTVVS